MGNDMMITVSRSDEHMLVRFTYDGGLGHGVLMRGKKKRYMIARQKMTRVANKVCNSPEALGTHELQNENWIPFREKHYA